LTELALAVADRVVFSSTHTRNDALAEELVDAAHTSVVHLGVDDAALDAGERAPTPGPPSGAEPVASGVPAIFCLGTDYHHKNRMFALRVLECLRDRHGWTGVLVFAGPRVGHGSSRHDEARLLTAHPELAGAVLDVGVVSEAEKAWLLARSALVLYPSVIEGFGFVPFEAAAHGTPCMWAPGTSLSDILPDHAAEIVPWDAELSAGHALTLIREEAAREGNVETLRAAAEPLTWAATATQLIELYEATADAPARTSNALDVAGALTQGALGEDAMRLVGPGGELPRDVHRPLLALATHPRVAAPVFGALKLGYRASHRLRRELHKRT
jgi:glycosyltransferase involved in cell wall biosynthesis